MPLRRSPPKKSSELLCDSEPDKNLSTSSHQLPTNTSQRFKRKHQQGDELNDFMSEIKMMFTDFTEKQDKKYNALLSFVNEIKIQSTEIQKTTEFLSTKYDELLRKLSCLENANKEKMAYIQILENQIENLEMTSKSSSIEIRNIPPNRTETKATICETVINTAKILKVPLTSTDINDIYRLKSRSEPSSSTIILNLTTVIAKEKMLQAYKLHNRNNSKNRLSTKDLQVDGPTKLIFMSENLSAKKRRLFYLTREKAKLLEYNYCWISNGKILVRREEGTPAIRIELEADLHKLQLIGKS